jgi:hypothetical protein
MSRLNLSPLYQVTDKEKSILSGNFEASNCCKLNPNQRVISHVVPLRVEPHEGDSDATVCPKGPANKVDLKDISLGGLLEGLGRGESDEQEDLFQLFFSIDEGREIDLKVKIQGKFVVTLLYSHCCPSCW